MFLIFTIIYFRNEYLVNQERVSEIIYEDNYSISIYYPDKLPRFLNKMIQDKLTNLKKDFLETIKDKKVSGAHYELVINYEVNEYHNYKFITFNHYSYTADLNSNHQVFTYIYDFKNNEVLELTDLFKNNYLEVLSKLSRFTLRNNLMKDNKVIDEETFNEGTKAKKENFSNLYFDKSALVLIFPDYQIGSWSNSSELVKISYWKIDNIIKKDLSSKSDDEDFEGLQPQERDLSKFKDKKLIALSFDDGPSYLTKKLINLSKEKDVKFTFFVLGSRLKEFNLVLKEAYENQNQICNHSYSHRNFLNLSLDDVAKEINSTNNLIEEITGQKSDCYRPPYGDSNLKIREHLNLKMINWNIDPEDWKYRDSLSVSNHIINNVSDGSIILLHDIYESSIDAALIVVDELLKQGYAFVTIDELIELKNYQVDNRNIIYSIR